jgi:hypothetical protein
VSNKRLSLHDRQAAQPELGGSEAIVGAPGAAQTGERRGAAWEAANKRLTFYCPRELEAELKAEMNRSGRSKSQVLVDALRAELYRTRGGRSPR